MLKDTNERIRTLRDEVTSITTQLHHRKGHLEWRKKAIKALRYKEEELHTLKRLRLQQMAEFPAKDGTVDDLLCVCLKIVKRLLSEGGTLAQGEQEWLDLSQGYLRSKCL